MSLIAITTATLVVTALITIPCSAQDSTSVISDLLLETGDLLTQKLEKQRNDTRARVSQMLENSKKQLALRLEEQIEYATVLVSQLRRERTAAVVEGITLKVSENVAFEFESFGSYLEKDYAAELDGLKTRVSNYKNNSESGLIKNLKTLKRQLDVRCQLHSSEWDNKCIEVVTREENDWVEGQNYCKALGGKLLEIDNILENNFVGEMASYAEYKKRMYIGLLKLQHEWLKQDYFKMTFSRWKKGQPNGGPKLKSGLDIWRYYGAIPGKKNPYWYDDDSRIHQYWICQYPKKARLFVWDNGDTKPYDVWKKQEDKWIAKIKN